MIKKERYKILSLFLVVALLFSSISINIIEVSADDSVSISVWNGSDIDIDWFTGNSDEYTISSAAQLAGMASLVNSNSEDFSDITITLTANIDLGGKEWTTIGVGETYRFKGTFDGNGYTISNLTITSSSHYQGLFSSLTSATIKNLGIINPDISGNSTIGAIVAYAPGSDNVIENCYTSGGSVSGSSYVGGIIGYFNGTLTNCYNEGTTVSGTGTSIGGLIGFAAGGTVSNCYNTGTVSTDDYTYTIDLTYYNYMYEGLEYEEMKNEMIAQEIANDLAYSCGVNIGGIVGEVDNATISDCYSVGNIIVGDMSVSVDGEISYDDSYVGDRLIVDTSSATFNIGGVAGSTKVNRGSVSNCYYNSSNISSSTSIDSTSDGDALTYDDMSGTNAIENMYLDADIWEATDTYPILKSSIFDTSDDALTFENAFANGDGTSAESAYEISSIEELNNLATLVNEGNDTTGIYFIQTEDIEVEDDYSPIGLSSTYCFCGNYNGNGKTIRGTIGTIYDAEDGGVLYKGVFGYTSNATIKNLAVSINVYGYQYVGGVTGYNDNSIISNCYNTGNITAGSYVGGIAGYNSGTISNCYNTGYITTRNSYVGGIVGSNYGDISNCYNIGNIKVNLVYSGGIVGEGDSGTITNCYYNKDNITAVLTNKTNDGTALMTSQMTGYSDDTENRAQDNMIGFDSSVWTFTDNDTDILNGVKSTVYYYPVLTANTQDPIPSVTKTIDVYTVDITLGDNMTSSSSIYQVVDNGTVMTSIVITTDSNYYFPSSYIDSLSASGITVTRTDANTITISGTPIASYELILEDATEIVNAETPSVTKVLEDATYEYGETVTVLDATATVTDEGMLSYQWYSSNDNLEWSIIEGEESSTYTPSNTLIGTTYYKIEVVNTITDNGDGGTKCIMITSDTVSVTIEKINATISVPTAIENLVYIGSAQELIIAGSTSGGTIYYSIDGVNYSTHIPTGINAGVYTVYYKVIGDDNYNDIDVETIVVTITEICEDTDDQLLDDSIDTGNTTNKALYIMMLFISLGMFICTKKQVD